MLSSGSGLLRRMLGLELPNHENAPKPPPQPDPDTPKTTVADDSVDEDSVDDDILQDREIPREDRFPVGTVLYKEFPDHGWYQGTIQYLSFGNRYYRVQYSDGDTEDLAHDTVRQLLLQNHPPRSAAAELLTTMNNNNQKKKSVKRKVTASSSDDNDKSAQQQPPTKQMRRSDRDRTSTVIFVGKDAVKKENNYVVQGLSYHYGENISDTNTSRPATKKPPPRQPPTQQKPRPPTALEARRKTMKDKVLANIAAKEERQRAFLQQHRAVLEPFCDATVLQRLFSPRMSAKNNQNDASLPLTANSQSGGTTIREPDALLFMQPDAITTDLRDYQLEGLNWMARMHANNISMLLGDEMGLGKTIQTISLICHLKERYGTTGPSLIVCPLSVLYSWCSEITKWAPSLKFVRFHMSTPDASMTTMDLNDYDMVITTYECCKHSALQRLWSLQHFNLLVLDEGHRIKSADTLVAQAVRRIHSESRLILTGTPLANNLVELYSLLQFLQPNVFTTPEPFMDAFDLNSGRTSKSATGSSSSIVIDPHKLQQAHTLLQVFMLRRLKQQVEKLMPRKLETRVECPLSNTQIWFYKALLLKDLNLLAGDGKSAGGVSRAKALNNLVLQLRKCCIHPFLFDGVEGDPTQTTLEEFVGASGKLSVLDQLLCSLYEKKHRVVLFSQFTRCLDILEDYCDMRGWKYCRFDGGTARAKRNFVVNSFNAPDSNKFIFLMSTRSGGMGLNLQTADTCILFDSDWNPQPDLQAIARIHRIGQTKMVHIYRLVTSQTVEQRMVERAEKKLYLDRMVIQDGLYENEGGGTGGMDDDDEPPDASRLLATLRFGCNAVFGNNSKKQQLPSAADIDLITDRSRTEDLTVGNLVGGAASTVQDFDATKDFSATTEFGGIDFKAIREQYKNKKRPNDVGAIGDLWAKKRERKNRIKMVDGAGSGYGSSVPVLKSNDYELATGEKSVFERELKGRSQQTKKKQNQPMFLHQDFCQVCFDGGDLVLCPRCPIALHLDCAGINHPNELKCCSQHHCDVCDKNTSQSGGFLFVCASACTKTFCEDHVPAGARMLGDGCPPRFEKLGYNIKHGQFIHCSEQCEKFSEKELGWLPPSKQERPSCPPPLDVASQFGGEVDDCVDAPEDLVVTGKRQRNKVNYVESDLGTKESPPTAKPRPVKGYLQMIAANVGKSSPAKKEDYEVELSLPPDGKIGISLGEWDGKTVALSHNNVRVGTKLRFEISHGDQIIGVDGVNLEHETFIDCISFIQASKESAQRTGGLIKLRLRPYYMIKWSFTPP